MEDSSVGPIDDAIVHLQWLIDLTMLSRHRDSPHNPPHRNTVLGKKMTEPLNTRWEKNIYFNTFSRSYIIG